MFEGVRSWLLRMLKVPERPRPPAGSHVLRTFRAAPNYFRYRVLVWAMGQCGALIGLFWGLRFAAFASAAVPFAWLSTLITVGELLALATFIGQLPLSYALLRLDFDMRWYLLTDRSLHIREGTVRLNEKSITFANIQNISIHQNPLQRLLGISDVRVRTAGGGESGAGTPESGGMHEAIFHGVDNAEGIRDAVRERVRLHRDAGLGDTDDPEFHPPLVGSGDAVLAARAVLREVRALRAVFMLVMAFVVAGCAPRTPRMPELAPPQQQFWAALQDLCGRAFSGTVREAPANDTSFAGRELTMHVSVCRRNEIRIPFHVGTNRSRTWVLTRTAAGLRLKHDHRHEDGTEDAVTQYGGDTRGAGESGRQEFYADAHTAQIIPPAVTNVWTVEVATGKTFAYALRREGTDRRFRIEFDLSRPAPLPPPAWGFEKLARDTH